MKRIYFFLLHIICVSLSKNAFAQFQGNVYRQNIDAKVFTGTDSLLNAWDGGYNSLQVINADLNGDNVKDLVLYDQNTGVVKTYINIGLNGTIKYQYQPKYALNFPPIRSYLKLQDYNCDGIPDLFHRSDFGFGIYKGSYVNNELHFTYYKDLWYSSQSGMVNVYVQNNDIPELKDIDGDGDLDILAFDVFGTVLNYYRNTRVETNAKCDSFNVVFEANCWGKFIQSYWQTVFLGGTCKGFVPNAFINTPANEIYNDLDSNNTYAIRMADKKQRHSGNCITVFDENCDGKLDLISGGVGYNNVQVLYNAGGNNATANFTSQDTTYKNIYLSNWPSTFYTDINNDGANDLIISPHSEMQSGTEWADVNHAMYYKNIGTNVCPNFQYQTSDLFFDQTIDLGANSYPTFFDYNKDGKPDLFIGSEGILDTSDNSLRAKIAYYKNTSDTGKISFTLVTNDFLNLSNKNYKGLFPTFGDVTGDGISDLVLGTTNGKLIVYKNSAPAEMAIPALQFYSDSFQNIFINNSEGSTFNYTFPAVFDVNFDGKNDIVIGDKYGKLWLFQDSSTAVNTSKFWQKTSNLGNLQAGGKKQYLGYAAPTICRTDNTLKKYLVIGNGDGAIQRYDSLNANNIYGPYVQIDSIYSNIQLPYRAVPAFADIDGDGKMDIVIGNRTGGVYLYNQFKNITDSTKVDSTDSVNLSIINIDKSNKAFSIYPNPSAGIYNVKAQTTADLPFTITVYSTTGQELIVKKNNNTLLSEINLSTFANGLYNYKITSAKNTKTGLLIKQ